VLNALAMSNYTTNATPPRSVWTLTRDRTRKIYDRHPPSEPELVRAKVRTLQGQVLDEAMSDYAL